MKEPKRLTQEASNMFLRLGAESDMLRSQINALVLGAGIVGEYQWERGDDGIVTLTSVKSKMTDSHLESTSTPALQSPLH